MGGGLFALVTFEDAEDCEHAIFNMNESEFFGKTIQVSYAKGQHLRLLHGPRGKNGAFQGQAVWKSEEEFRWLYE